MNREIDFEKLDRIHIMPVVYCRDCKWCHAGYCEKYDDVVPFGCADRPWEEWFCADGELPANHGTFAATTEEAMKQLGIEPNDCGADMREEQT